MKLKEIVVYLLTITINIALSFFFNLIIFSNNQETFIFSACGTILLVLLVTYIVAYKMSYKLDIFAYDIKDIKYLIINSIFIGSLFSIPLAMFIAMIL